MAYLPNEYKPESFYIDNGPNSYYNDNGSKLFYNVNNSNEYIKPDKPYSPYNIIKYHNGDKKYFLINIKVIVDTKIIICKIKKIDGLTEYNVKISYEKQSFSDRLTFVNPNDLTNDEVKYINKKVKPNVLPNMFEHINVDLENKNLDSIINAKIRNLTKKSPTTEYVKNHYIDASLDYDFIRKTIIGASGVPPKYFDNPPEQSDENAIVLVKNKSKIPIDDKIKLSEDRLIIDGEYSDDNESKKGNGIIFKSPGIGIRDSHHDTFTIGCDVGTTSSFEGITMFDNTTGVLSTMSYGQYQNEPYVPGTPKINDKIRYTDDNLVILKK